MQSVTDQIPVKHRSLPNFSNCLMVFVRTRTRNLTSSVFKMRHQFQHFVTLKFRFRQNIDMAHLLAYTA